MYDSELKLITIADLMRYFDVCRQTIVNYRKKGLPFIRLTDGSVRFEPSEIKNWLEARKLNVSQPRDDA